MKIGIIGFQGDINEHIRATEAAIYKMQISGEAIWIRDKLDLFKIDGLIIPGGESTTIGNLITHSGMFENIRELSNEGLPILGTCAGMILMAKKGGKDIKKTRQPLLELMNMKVIRNAFGRQKDSFETELEIPKFGNKPFPGLFIRAPAIEEVWDNAKPIVTYKDKIVAAEQENLLAIAFHPELTSDTRAHEYFLEKVMDYSSKK